MELRVDPSKGTVESLIWGVRFNVRRELLRAEVRAARAPGLAAHAKREVPTPLEEVIREESRSLVRRALVRLSPVERELVIREYGIGVGATTRPTLSRTDRSRLCRARAKLRRMLAAVWNGCGTALRPT